MKYSITTLCGNSITAAKKARKMRLSCQKEQFNPNYEGVFSLYAEWDDNYHHFLCGLEVFPDSCGNFNYYRKTTYFLENEYYLYFCGEVDGQLVWEYTEHEDAKTLNLLDSWAEANEETDKIIHCIKYCRDVNQMIRNVHSSLNPLKTIPLI